MAAGHPPREYGSDQADESDRAADRNARTDAERGEADDLEAQARQIVAHRLGNVLTQPDQRRQGLARALTATLAHRLLAAVPVVGLNVGTANTGARALYEALGFVPVTSYEEAELRRD